MDLEDNCITRKLSRKSATISDQGTIPEPSTPHIGKGVALVALAATLVYIYAKISQIAVNQKSFYATQAHGAAGVLWNLEFWRAS